MAPATTSPVKILTDLGYEVWEMETDADMLRALVEAINTLTITNPSDGRIPILQSAVIEIRKGRRAASPSKGMKVTEKRKTLKGSNFIPRAKPAPKPKVSPVAMLPPAQEEESNQSIFAGLLNGLKGIASLLKNISALLGIQFIFKKALAARRRRLDAIEAKKKREQELEGDDEAGLGKKIRDTITKPIKSFWDTLLNFFKNIILGSAVLGFYKWMKDPKNQETIKGISDWLEKNGEGVLKGILAILTLGIGFRVYRLVSRIGKAAFKISKIVGRVTKTVLQKLLERFGKRALQTSGGAVAYEVNRKALNTAVTKLANQIFMSSGGQIPIDDAFKMARKQLGVKQPLSRIIAQRYDSLIGLRDKGIRSIKGGIDTIRNVPSSVSKILTRARGIANPNFGKLASRTKPPVTSVPVNVFKKADTGLDLLSKSDPKLAKLIAEGLKKTTLDPLRGVAKPRNILGQSSEMILDAIPTESFPKVGEKLLKEGGEKVASKGAIKFGLKTLIKGLPLLGTYLDTAAMIEEIKKGNYTAAGFFGVGAITSLLPGAQGISLGASLSGIAASAIEDKMKESPDLSMNKKKKEVNVVVVPSKSGGSSSNPSGGTSEISSVPSTDPQNPYQELSKFAYNIKGAE
jgi:predicted negative regulator of RcsB-dependent stress response